MDTKKKGKQGEELAAKLLEHNGYEILCMNYRKRSGEIDIVAKDGEYLCFVEVKYRKTVGSGYPEEAVGPAKMRKIRHTALFYMFENKIPDTHPVRFDVCLILGGQYRIIKNAFDA
ncbi:MAG: YraN family protein [Lachnospiraceae bacterium]|nr:YraN family protein [Lachnospiraceae bacterium]MBP5184612.1 YraN family protein [Lachnospiraceae bacterium]